MTVDPENEQVRKAFKEAFANARRDGKIPRRTRADVTADRLGDEIPDGHDDLLRHLAERQPGGA